VLDNSLAGDGVLTHAVGLYAFTNAMVRQPDGRIILGGAGSGDGFVLTRFTGAGAVDPGFSDGVEDNIAQVVTPFPGNYTQLEALGLQADGKVLAAGGVSNDLVLVRYQNSVASAVAEGPTAKPLPVFPNPVGHDGIIRFGPGVRQDLVRLVLSDGSGRIIRIHAVGPAGPAVMDVRGMAGGSYVVHAYHRDGSRSTATVVIP
ncbi:MAG: hypothetical protein ACO1NQ_09805, partial [Flavobacteriales bacterium]